MGEECAVLYSNGAQAGHAAGRARCNERATSMSSAPKCLGPKVKGFSAQQGSLVSSEFNHKPLHGHLVLPNLRW